MSMIARPSRTRVQSANVRPIWQPAFAGVQEERSLLAVKAWIPSELETISPLGSQMMVEERASQENVRLEERTRIARELHDTILQTFVGAFYKLGAAVESLPQESQIISKLNSILQVMEQGIQESRNAIQGLRSSGPGESDLGVALSAVHLEFSPEHRADFYVNVIGQERRLSPAIHDEIYHIGREALVNAFCHAGAKRIELDLEYTGAGLAMRVRDDGGGIDPQVLDTGKEGHWGLTGMQERAARIGGLLEISSSATTGTEIKLSVPSRHLFEL